MIKIAIASEKAKQVAKENNINTVILDGPPGIGCPVISTITGVDKVIIVTEPSISGLHDMKRTLEIVKKFGTEAFVIINKFDLNPEISIQIDSWCTDSGVHVIGHLPFEPQIVEAMVQGLSITEFDSGLNISKKISEIWNKIINPTPYS